MQYQIELLSLQWHKLMVNFNLKPIQTKEAFIDLVSKYSSPNRFYHNLKHIFYVLATIETLQDYARNLVLLKFAAWFHDIIYDTKADDNEQKSAIYAVNTLESLVISNQVAINPRMFAEDIAKVKHLIMSTKTHNIDIEDIDTQILIDADLRILGSQPTEYKKYAQYIRQEYAWVNEDHYRVARKRVLEEFLQRKSIYSTRFMYEKYEQIARRNIKTEIEYCLP